MGDQIIYLEKYIDSEWGQGGWAEGRRSCAGQCLNSSRMGMPLRPAAAHVHRLPTSRAVGSLATPAGTTSLPAELNRILNSIKDLDERSDGEMLGWARRAVAHTVAARVCSCCSALAALPIPHATTRSRADLAAQIQENVEAALKLPPAHSASTRSKAAGNEHGACTAGSMAGGMDPCSASGGCGVPCSCAVLPRRQLQCIRSAAGWPCSTLTTPPHLPATPPLASQTSWLRCGPRSRATSAC